jgi:chromosome segregation ATPase
MTTSTIEEQGVDLEQAIERLDEQIGKQRAEVAEWEGKQREAASLLAELQSSYAEAAAEVVQGRRAPTEKLAKQIEDLREKLLGFGRVVVTKRAQLSDLQSRLQPFRDEQTRLVRMRMIAEERAAVEKDVADAAQALTDLDAAAARFGNGLTSLRQREYIDEGTRHFAFDQAFALQRRSNGMRA